jgi:hypothetical protein
LDTPRRQASAAPTFYRGDNQFDDPKPVFDIIESDEDEGLAKSGFWTLKW